MSRAEALAKVGRALPRFFGAGATEADMSDKTGTSIPWAGIAVVLTFVSSTLLQPRPFEPLRPAEKERGQPSLQASPEIDARLWEDPFGAWRRYEAERAERCAAAKATGDRAAECTPSHSINAKRHPDRLLDQLGEMAPGQTALLTYHPSRHKLDDTLVIAALMPGQPFVGAEEYRRRTRYAMLAGLQAMRFVPSDAEHLGVLQFSLSPPAVPPRDAAKAERRPQRAGARARDAALRSSAAAKAATLSASAPASGERMLIAPYEVLSASSRPSDDTARPDRTPFRRIALVWINEEALPAPKLDALARVLAQLLDHAATPPHLAVIGPSSSDALRTALAELQAAVDRHRTSPGMNLRMQAGSVRTTSGPAPADAPLACRDGRASESGATADDDTMRGYCYLAQATLLDAASTVPSTQLEILDKVMPGGKPATLEWFVKDRLGKFLPDGSKTSVDYRRTIAADDQVLKSLAKELLLRLPRFAKRRVVLVAERDSVYAQALVSQLVSLIHEGKTGEAKGGEDKKRYENLTIEVVYFFRGIDGVTTREGNDKPFGGKTATDATVKPAMAIEWPESRDQLDYLRRLATSLQDSEAVSPNGPIGAIGIFANDVHDKLLVLQALHASFSDKVFFTTDMDARYLHPRTNAFTRNLVVASSLPLEFHEPAQRESAADRAAPAAAGCPPGRDGESPPASSPGCGLQAGTPPLRDVYQSATYLAARRAACRSAQCKERENNAATEVIDHPSIYEIGRHREVPLAGYDHSSRRDTGRSLSILVAALLGVFLAGTLLIWPSTPAVRSTRAGWTRRVALRSDAAQVDVSTAWLAALHATWLTFALGTLIEFVLPGNAGIVGLGLAAALSGLFAGLVLHPWPDIPAAAAASAHAWMRRLRGRSGLRVFALVLIVFCAVLAAAVWAKSPIITVAPCVECEPVAWLEGVSAWPSQLIHVMALAVVAWALDDFWSNTKQSALDDAAWLGLHEKAVTRLLRWAAKPRPIGRSLVLNSLSAWRRPRMRSVSFRPLWCAYLWRGRRAARAARIAIWYAVTVLMAAGLFYVFSQGYVPEVPVRGTGHRLLVASTLYAVLLMLPLLMVTVADATMLACRFTDHLCRGRAAFSPEVLARFAQTLGADSAASLIQYRAADPLDRRIAVLPPALAPADPQGPHTLLDDWIVVQLVARRTRVVGRLIIGPFIVLALIVVARSRLFDNWALTLPVALVAAAYLLWLMTLAAWLKLSAERLRSHALERMNADLRWLAGSGQPALAERFKQLVTAVETNTVGAFAPYFDQPLFKALLVPLGGAGSAQLFDLLLAR